MQLQGFSPLFEDDKRPVIVSKDKGSSCKHIAINDTPSLVAHYHIDGEVITVGPRCDFLLMNADTRLAYLIELKGRHVNNAIDQLVATEKALKSQLAGYSIRYRIVAGKSCKGVA